MTCYAGYIEIDSSTPSRSGLYATSLPGVEINLLDDLTPTDISNYEAFWDIIYKRAWDNLISDVTEKLQEKFFVDKKLVSRETSQFQASYNSGGIAGVRIDFTLPKYARLHVISIGVISENAMESPEFEINFNDTDANGEILHTINETIEAGRNTINVDTDFEVDSLFISYDSTINSLKKTENKYYSGFSGYDKIACMYPCSFGQSYVTQISGGGLNVKYVVYCSIEKFVCENINMFKQAFLWKIGNEIIVDRRYGNTINCFTAMTAERAEDLTEFFVNTYSGKLQGSIDGLRINEDPYCFNCKNPVTAKTILP